MCDTESTWKMDFDILCYIVLFCGRSLAHSHNNATETKSCNPDMCKFLVDFGAIMEKVNCMEAKLKESEARLKDTEMSLKETVTQLKQDSETKLNHTANRLKQSENQILELQHKGTSRAILLINLNTFFIIVFGWILSLTEPYVIIKE